MQLSCLLFVNADCWKILPQERATFSDLLEQIHEIQSLDIHPVETNDESYQSLQQDWRQEIQDMFEELKEKEQVKYNSSNSTIMLLSMIVRQ
jgi:hypothetical protein